MTKGLSGLRAFFDRFFPERQFYHRSHGEVHFVSLSGRTQMAYITLTLSFLTWVGYASVNVVFKEQIITEQQRNFVAKEKDLQQQVFDLQEAYDSINDALYIAERDFQQATLQLEKRHEELKSLVDHKQALNEQYDNVRETHFALRRNEKDPQPGQNNVLMRVTELEPTERRSRRAETASENPVNAVTNAVANMIKRQVGTRDRKADLAERVATLQNRVDQLRDRQRDLVFDLEEKAQNRIERSQAIITVTGLDIEDVVGKFENETIAAGGPLIALADADRIADLDSDDTDPTYRRQVFRLANKMQELSILEAAVTRIPLIMPVNADYRFTSGYGPRRDPKTRRRAFHSGADMAGKRGSKIVAAAPGTVTYAGPKGPYGNLIEIDHDYGFKTRYGHLQKILVKRGEKVDFYQNIGTLGNTGRSTGPHLHYEIWFNNKVRDPAKFFEAGNYVFKE